jgi:hypothetical protein
LRKKLIPQMQGKVLVDAAKTSDEMILEGADATFGCISVIHSRRYELEIDFLLMHKLLEDLGTFVVEALETRFQSGLSEMFVEGLVGAKDARSGSIFEWLGENRITIIVV